MIAARMTVAWLIWSIPAAMLVVMGIGWSLMRLLTAGPPRVREGYITGVVGRMGQGKSLYVMTLARRHLATGGTVISNFKMYDGDLEDVEPGAVYDVLGGHWTLFQGWVELLQVLVARLEAAERDVNGRPIIQPALVILDEAHLYAPANGQVLPDVARWILSHLRKLRAEAMWCTQHEARIASALAQQTSELVSVRRSKVAPRKFTAAHWEPEHFRKTGKECLFKVGYRLSPKVIAMYNSWDLITPDRHGDDQGVVAGLIARLEALGKPEPVGVEIRNVELDVTEGWASAAV